MGNEGKELDARHSRAIYLWHNGAAQRTKREQTTRARRASKCRASAARSRARQSGLLRVDADRERLRKAVASALAYHRIKRSVPSPRAIPHVPGRAVEQHTARSETSSILCELRCIGGAETARVATSTSLSTSRQIGTTRKQMNGKWDHLRTGRRDRRAVHERAARTLAPNDLAVPVLSNPTMLPVSE